MSDNLPENVSRVDYARRLADEARTLVPGMERLAAIATELKRDDLYRLLGFGTWESFCTGYLGVSKRTADRWISGQNPKPITAGQEPAVGQTVPVVESPALNSGAPILVDSIETPVPSPIPPDDTHPPISDGPPRTEPASTDGDARTRTQDSPRARGAASPRGTEPPVERESQEPAPIGEREVLRWLKDHTPQQIRSIATPSGTGFRSEIARWYEAFGLASEPRRSGVVIKPEDRSARLVPSGRVVVPNGSCPHPRASFKVLSYGTFCGECKVKVR